jgi:hypothetical protein
MCMFIGEPHHGIGKSMLLSLFSHVVHYLFALALVGIAIMHRPQVRRERPEVVTFDILTRVRVTLCRELNELCVRAQQRRDAGSCAERRVSGRTRPPCQAREGRGQGVRGQVHRMQEHTR